MEIGVTAREIDLTGEGQFTPTGVPAATISPTPKGRAYLPITVGRNQEYVNEFGNPTTDISYGPLSAKEWLETQRAFTQIRILGIGDGKKRTSDGSITYGGFIVGSQEPQDNLAGNLGNNAYANFGSPYGRTYFLSAFMSESSGSKIFTNALNRSTSTVLRGVLFAPSGVVLKLSCSNFNSNPLGVGTVVDEAGGTIRGFTTGTVNISGGKQEFVMLLNGFRGSDEFPERVITASFDPTAANYFGNILNKNPYKIEEAGHLLYANYDINSNIAVVTGSGYVTGALGTSAENIAFLVTSSLSRNTGSLTVPNFEGFADRYSHATSPWIISQKFGGTPANLFKVHHLSDGEENVKISIENILPSVNAVNPYGTFDLLVRDIRDVDSSKKVLESWRGLNLNPSSDRYIGKVIGDMNTYFDFDQDEGKQRIVQVGSYPNNSRFIRVELSEALEALEIDESALPLGFRGIQHIVTSGSAVFPNHLDSIYLESGSQNPFHNIMQPPVPFRLTLTKGATNVSVDKNLYWGIQFEKRIDATDLNKSTAFDESILNYTKFFPTYNTVNINFAVKDNTGIADSSTNGILDCDRFNNNLFTLENIRVKYNSTSSLPDTGNLTAWEYVRTGSISTDSTNFMRALAASDLSDPSTRAVAKFTLMLQGGFNGSRIFDRDSVLFTNKAVREELNNSARGLTNGPTVAAYLKGLEIIKDTSNADIQLLTVPGVRESYMTDTISTAIENERSDAMFIMDITERDNINAVVTSSVQIVSVKNTINDFSSRGMNTSYTAAYFPNVIMRDTTANRTLEVPPSVAVLGAFGKNDSLGHPWFAPAGFNRTALGNVNQSAVELSKQNLKDLQDAKINPIATFPGQKPVVWGQATLLASESAFERINVRRLLLTIRREVRKVAQRIMFEPNREETLARFESEVKPILKNIKDKRGLDAYLVEINTETTTEADILNYTIRGNIKLVPTKSVEAFGIDFVLTNQGAAIS